MISEAIDFKYLLLENYSKLKIKENELATIFMIDHLINQGNPFVTADLLTLKMNLDVKEIDDILANLLIRGFFEYKKVGKKTVASLDNLKKKLYHDFQISLSIEEENSNNEELTNNISKIINKYEELLDRHLSPVEKNRIGEWLQAGYTVNNIIDALKDALMKNKKSLRSVDKILLSYAQKEDLLTEGHTSISSSWDKNLEETIKIAKTPWIKK